MDLRKLKTLIDLVAESGIAELEITEGEGKVKIVKFSQTPPAAPVVSAAPVAVVAAPAAPAVSAPAEVAAASPEEQGFVVKSPMVGTFYVAANPNAEPFVKVGQTVKQGDPLCIIEAMKLLNEIEAEQSGVIQKIFVENGQPVEYGQPLFVIA